MTPMRKRRPSPAMVVALIALFVALGGTSYAVVAGSIGTREIRDNSIRSKDIRNGDLRGEDIKNATLTPKDLSANASAGLQRPGPQGPPGAQGQLGLQGPSGSQGPAGSSASRYFATVTSSGTLASGTATGVQRIAAGVYDVAFGADISRCTGVLTAGRNQATLGGAVDDFVAQLYVGGKHTWTVPGAAGPNANTVAVDLYSLTNPDITVDSGFHLAVLC